MVVITPSDENQLAVKPAEVLIRTNDSYPMTRPCRGSCVIINNFKFKDATIDRPEAELDVDRIENLFEECCFNVIKFHNLKATEILDVLVKCSKCIGPHDEAFVCLLSSHGAEGTLMGTDGDFVAINDILDLFSNVNCPRLKMKPKLFFLQACRGRLADRGIADERRGWEAPTHDEGKEDDIVDSPASLISSNLEMERTLPEFSDMYIAFAAVHQYKAKKSWFLEELYKEFAEWAYQEDLETLMRRVTTNVIERFFHTQDETIARKQCPEIILRGWRKRLFFNPGLPENEDVYLPSIKRLWVGEC